LAPLLARLRHQAEQESRPAPDLPPVLAQINQVIEQDCAVDDRTRNDGTEEAETFLVRLGRLIETITTPAASEPTAPEPAKPDPLRPWLLARAAALAEPLPLPEREALRRAVWRHDRFLHRDLLCAGWGAFTDIGALPDEDIQTLIRQVTAIDLAEALKAAPADLRARFFDNIAPRAAEFLKEDMDAMGPVRLRDALDAQRRIMDAVRSLIARGEITGWGGR